MATTSFTLRQTISDGGSALQRTYAVYSSGASAGASYPVYDSALKSDDYIPVDAVTQTAFDTYTFTAEVFKRTEVELSWQLQAVLTTPTTGTYVPIEMTIVASSTGHPVTPLDGKTVASFTASTFVSSVIDSGETYISDGAWVYYSMFIKYGNNVSGNEYYTRVALVSVQIPRDFGSTNDLWQHIPSYYRSIDEDYQRNTPNYPYENGPLYRFVELFGWELDKIRTTIYDTMRINDPEVIHTSAIDALAKQMGVDLTQEALGASKLRTILNNIGYLQRNKGTIDSIEAYITALSGCNLTTNTSVTPVQFNVHPQRVSLVTDPFFKQAVTTTDNTGPIYRQYSAQTTGGSSHGWGVYVDKSVSETWTARSAAEANSWTSITYGNGLFVAVARDGTNRIMTSPDGITWTSRSTPANHIINSVTYGNGLFVAVGESDTRVLTSPDGITWTKRSASSQKWTSVTYGNNLFVAVAFDGSKRAMTSTDGITWTLRDAPTDGTWQSVTYGNGLFVAVSLNNGWAMTSPDGITWTLRNAKPGFWTSITYGNGLFVAVSQSGTNYVMTSPDGITWTARSAAENNIWTGVTYGNGLFIAVASSGTNRVMTSPDGITWTIRSAAEANSWGSVCYGNGLFVAVAGNGTNRVMTSTDGATSIAVSDSQVTVNSPIDAKIYIYSRGAFAYNNSLPYYASATSSHDFNLRFISKANMLAGLEATGGSESVTFYDSWANSSASSAFPRFNNPTENRKVVGNIPNTGTVSVTDVIPVFYFNNPNGASATTLTFSLPMVEPRNSSGAFFSGSSTDGGFIPTATSANTGAFDYKWGKNDAGAPNSDFSYYTSDDHRSRKVTEYMIQNYVAPVTFVKNTNYVINWDVLE